MKDYIKPTFVTANIFPVALAGNSCTVSNKERQEICDIFGIKDWNTAFAVGESCETQYPITDYCKYTHIDASDKVNIVIGS